ncbi:protein YoaL [Lelliottia amnigena]|uniref:protein YoaL n=1 Tax=Lelliottia amnigena TaxID=61646 RepID=UPI003B588128
MDRHRRQSSTRPFSASLAGDSCHTLNMSTAISPTSSVAPFCHSFSRSLSWNS